MPRRPLFKEIKNDRSQDLIHLLSRLTNGSQEDRLRWIFNLYDLDQDGEITRQEMGEKGRNKI